MDIKINAHGRYIEITNVNTGSLEELTDTALGAWLATEKAKQDDDSLEAGASIITDRADNRTGFAYVSEGERLDTK